MVDDELHNTARMHIQSRHNKKKGRVGSPMNHEHEEDGVDGEAMTLPAHSMNQAKPVLQSGSPGKFNNLVGQNFESEDEARSGLNTELLHEPSSNSMMTDKRGYKAVTPQHANTPMHNSTKRDNASS